MKIPKYLSFSIKNQQAVDTGVRARRCLGYLWSSITSLPRVLYQLAMRVAGLANSFFETASIFKGRPLGGRNISKRSAEVEEVPRRDEGEVDPLKGKEVLKGKEIQVDLLVDEDNDPLANLGAMSSSLVESPAAQSSYAIRGDDEVSIANDGAKELVKSAEDLLARPNPETKEDYTDLILRLESEALRIENELTKTYRHNEGLKEFLSDKIFELKAKVEALSEQFCVYMGETHKPNSHIPDEGSCFYWSVRAEVEQQHHPDRNNDKRGMQQYRTQAANYIRGQCDGGNLKYMIENDTIGELERYLGHDLNDLEALDNEIFKEDYCRCVEEEHMYATDLEINGLSNQLQTPILIFQPVWGGSLENGLRLQVKGSEFVGNGKKPIYIYYNGSNHYQNLVLKSTD